jgi:hypothetical protein
MKKRCRVSYWAKEEHGGGELGIAKGGRHTAAEFVLKLLHHQNPI